MNEEEYIYQCPECGFVVSQIEYESIMFEPTCRCGKKWSYFEYKKFSELK